MPKFREQSSGNGCTAQCTRKKKEFFEMVGRIASVMRSRVASKGKMPGPAFPNMAFPNGWWRSVRSMYILACGAHHETFR